MLPAPPPAPPAPPAPDGPQRIDPLTVFGTRESRTAGSAHVLAPRDLERMNYDNPETVTKSVPGVYARPEDGLGLRPNIGIRGTSPDRSKKVTLMEDGILFAPAPYSAPAAYFFPLITRMELVRVIKGPGAVSFGPQTVGGAIDLVTRGIPADDGGAIDLGAGAYGYGKLHGYYGASTARSGYLIEGVHLRSSGFKEIDGGGDTGFEKNEWMWKGRYVLSTDPRASQSVSLKLGYSDEDSRESYLGLSDADLRANPDRRYRASLLDRMQWHRTQVVGGYQARFGRAFALNAAVYRHDFSRTWRKLNRMGAPTPIVDILASPGSAANAPLYNILTGAADSASLDGGLGTLYIGPNRREFVSQGVQLVGSWQGTSGPIEHRLEAGVRYHYDRIERLHTEDGFLMQAGQLVPDGTPTLTTANVRNWAHALATHVAGAATWRTLTLTPGVRMENIRTFTRDRRMGVELTGTPQRVVIPGVGAYLIPLPGAAPALGLLAGVYRGFSPGAPPQPAGPEADAPATVTPETSVNYEAGVRFSPPRHRLRLEAIGFFNDYQNLTSICTFANGCTGDRLDRQSNAGRAYIYGTEIFARAEPRLAAGVTLPLMLAYTYTRTELLESFRSEDPSLGIVQPGDELPFVPRHQGAATVAVDTSRGSLSVAGSYVSSMRERAGQGDDPGAPRTDASFILDVLARAPVAARGEVYLGVRNLLGAADIAAHLPFGARPVAPRWIQVGTKWAF
jgi:Fe(3+) dicitrate transport protein